MLLLSLRTDKPEAEIGLFDDEKQLAYETWSAHRQLAGTLHQKINSLLEGHGKQLSDLRGIICYKGPGSFTGLRIGLSVANGLAYGLQIPIIGKEGEVWLDNARQAVIQGKSDTVILPEYGAPVHITQARK